MHSDDEDGNRTRAKAVRFIQGGQYYDARMAVRRLAVPGPDGNGSDIEAEQTAREFVDLADDKYLIARALKSLADRDDRAALIYVCALCLKHRHSRSV